MQGAFGRELTKTRFHDIDAREARVRPAPAQAFGHARRGGTAVRIGFGVVWLIDASLKWLPGFRSSVVGTIRGAAAGQPLWLHGWFAFWINLLAPRAMLFAYLMAVIETGIALALILGFARKLTYLLSIAFTLMLWATAEGFGGPYASGASDIGTAIIYALVFVALLVIDAGSEPSRYTLDARLARRWPWWHRVAEVGRRPIDAWTRRPPGSGAVAFGELDES